MTSYRYAKQPTEPRNPAVGSIWLNTATGEKQRRGADGWQQFVEADPARGDQVVRHVLTGNAYRISAVQIEGVE